MMKFDIAVISRMKKFSETGKVAVKDHQAKKKPFITARIAGKHYKPGLVEYYKEKPFFTSPISIEGAHFNKNVFSEEKDLCENHSLSKEKKSKYFHYSTVGYVNEFLPLHRESTNKASEKYLSFANNINELSKLTMDEMKNEIKKQCPTHGDAFITAGAHGMRDMCDAQEHYAILNPTTANVITKGTESLIEWNWKFPLKEFESVKDCFIDWVLKSKTDPIFLVC